MSEAAAPTALIIDTLDAMIEDIVAQWGNARTPVDLRTRLIGFCFDHKQDVDRLTAQLAATVAWWIVKGAEAGHDRDVLEQVALQQTLQAISAIAKAVKQRQGEPYSPARLAIVAYHVAMDVGALGPASVDLEGIAGAIDGLASDIESERDALRELIEEIADMDVGDVEIEHREIIARCRAEAKKWADE